MKINIHEIKVDATGKSKEEIKKEVLEQMNKQVDEMFNTKKEERANEKTVRDANPNDPSYLELKVRILDDDTLECHNTMQGTKKDIINMIGNGVSSILTESGEFSVEDAIMFSTWLARITTDRMLKKEKEKNE